MKCRFTDTYLDYAKEITDSPDVFLQWGALLAISSCLSRSVYLEIGSWNISPHLWIVLIGKSSSHKSMTLSHVEDMIEASLPNRLAPSEFSQEAIIHCLAENSSRLFIFDEAKSFFDSMGKKYNEGLKSLLTTLYRKPNYSRTTLKHGTLSIQGCYMTMGMATTPEWLRESLVSAEDSAMSGFLARFLMIPYTGKGNTPLPKPPPHNREKWEALVERLRQFNYIARPFAYEPDADRFFVQWFHETTERQNEAAPVLGPFFEHFKNEAVHKLAMVFAIDRGETSITLGAIKEAVLSLSYIEETLPSLLEDISSSKWDRERKRLVTLIRSRGLIKRSELSRSSGLSGQHLTSHISGLIQDHLVLVENISTNSKPGQIVRWDGD